MVRAAGSERQTTSTTSSSGSVSVSSSLATARTSCSTSCSTYTTTTNTTTTNKTTTTTTTMALFRSWLFSLSNRLVAQSAATMARRAKSSIPQMPLPPGTPPTIEVPVLTLAREQVGTATLDSRVFLAPVRTDLIHRYGASVRTNERTNELDRCRSRSRSS